VTLSNAPDLKDALSTTIRLVPASPAGAQLLAISIGGTAVGTFLCGAGTTNPIPTKYLPGSCKS
jgi:type IV pilus assembly protein PilA